MLIRNSESNIIEINRFDYTNDILFYKKIMENKINFTKLDKINMPSNYTKNRINVFLQETLQNKE
jgi:hypothetical protein